MRQQHTHIQLVLTSCPAGAFQELAGRTFDMIQKGSLEVLCVLEAEC